MKKLMKAIALVTVLCMAISVSAFAYENGSATPETATRTIDVEVTGAQADEQVVLLMVNSETVTNVASVSENDIMYIDQTAAGEDGVASFNDVKILNEDVKVDVYVGCGTFAEAKLIGEDISVKGVEKITLVQESIIEVQEGVIGAGGSKEGYGVALNVNIPSGTVVSAMVWSFDVKIGEETKTRRYSQKIVNPIADNATGNIQLAAAFTKGFVEENVVVSNPGAIFLTYEDGKAVEHFTNDVDAAKAEAKKNN